MDTPDSEHDADTGEDPALPHWTEPGTGEIPRLGSDADEDLAAWSGLGSTGPRWADDVEPPTPSPVPITSDAPVADVAIGGGQVEDDFFTYDEGPGARRPREAPRRAAEPPRRDRPGNGGGIDADLMPRVLTGLLLGAVAIGCLALGSGPSLLLVAAALGLAASEFFVSLRRVGYQPVTLLGLVACVALPLGSYWRGPDAFGVVLFLFIVFGSLWYLLGVGNERPVPNLGVTALGVVYIGILGSFAALLLDLPDGTWLLFVAILLAVGYDIGGYFVGRAMGRAPLSDVSPNKTIEGLMGGVLTATIVSIIVGILELGPFGDAISLFDTLLIGIAAALVAPIGDLAESLMKRDLGLKDMGTILPGHGGVLDRFDALLFVLPTVYFMLRLVA